MLNIIKLYITSSKHLTRKEALAKRDLQGEVFQVLVRNLGKGRKLEWDIVLVLDQQKCTSYQSPQIMS